MSVSELGRVSLAQWMSDPEGQRRFAGRLWESLSEAGWGDGPGAEGAADKGSGRAEGALEDLLARVRSDAAATHALVSLGGGERDRLEVVAAVGFGEPERATAWMEAHGGRLASRAAREGPVVDRAPLPGTGAAAVSEGEVGSVLCVPVRAGGTADGMLVLGRVPSQEWSPADRKVLRSAAFLLGQTVRAQSAEEESRGILYAMIQSLAAALDARDAYTRGHSDRVSVFAMAIANELEPVEAADRPGGFRDALRLGALLHDVGKIGIRDDILLKPAALTDGEYDIIKTHPVLGADIVRSSSALDYVIPGILYHHERWNGSGYPVGLRGSEIPLTAQIIGLADCFDAMTSDRTFRPGLSQEETIGIIRNFADTHFAPAIVNALLRSYQKGVLKSVRIAAASLRPDAGQDASSIEKAFPGLAEKIPSLPAVVVRLNRLVQDSDCSVQDIARVLSTDEGLVARVLRIANSAFYALPGRVASIPLAVTILGITSLRSLVIGTAMAEITRRMAGSPEAAERLWDHGVEVGVWSRWIARRLGGVDPEEAFTAGLLHDIGKGLVLRALPPERQRVRDRLLYAEHSGTLEKETLGFDHTELGGWAVNRWHLPEALVEAVRWHHHPERTLSSKPEVERLVGIVHVSNILARGPRDASSDALVDLLTSKADPVVLRTLPVATRATIEDLLPFVTEGIELARRLFSEPAGKVAAPA